MTKSAKIDKISYADTDQVISKMSEPSLKDVWTPYWDRPSFNMKNANRRSTNVNHKLPAGDGTVRRQKGAV